MRKVSTAVALVAASLLLAACAKKEEEVAPAADAAPGSGASDLLTSRQLQLLPLLADGMPNKRIADALGVTEGTVKTYLHGVFEKLGVETRAAAAAIAGRLLPQE